MNLFDVDLKRRLLGESGTARVTNPVLFSGVRDQVLCLFDRCEEPHGAVVAEKFPLAGMPQHVGPHGALGRYDFIANVTFLRAGMSDSM